MTRRRNIQARLAGSRQAVSKIYAHVKGLVQRTNILLIAAFASLITLCTSCEREPILYLHGQEEIDFELPIIDLNLEVLWNYGVDYGTNYNWRDEWYYGWDNEDRRLFGDSIGYVEPNVFNIRRYFTQDNPYAPHTVTYRHTISGRHLAAPFDWGFWDILAWNDIQTLDGVQSLLFDEQTSLDSVVAYTHQTMHSARYNAPRYTRAFYQPECLFSAYEEDIDINHNLEGFVYDDAAKVWRRTLNMVLRPITYIYLTQVIIHHNSGKIVGVDGSANLSGMARSTNLNTGYSGTDPVTVYYNVRFKNNCNKNGESVDIAGGRLTTFGICNQNPYKTRANVERNDVNKHYMDLTMQFNNGMDSTFVFDVTSQVKKRYLGGVLTVELDMDTIPIPRRSGGSGFDAVVKDFEDGGTHEFEM